MSTAARPPAFILVVLLALFISSPARASPSPEGLPFAKPSLGWSLDLGGMAGLDDFLRGLEARAGLGLTWQAWGLGLSTSLAWDASLDSARGLLGLDLDLGPDLVLRLAWEYGLKEASYTDGKTGALIQLESAGLPCHLAICVRLAHLMPLGPGGLSLKAQLSWSSYRVSAIQNLHPSLSEADYLKTLAGHEGFSAGFRATLYLSWSSLP